MDKSSPKEDFSSKNFNTKLGERTLNKRSNMGLPFKGQSVKIISNN